MNYSCPLSIFSESQLQHIYEGNLKLVKKEILLNFQLEDSVTIKLKNKEWDKNSIIKKIEEIEDNVELHSNIFRNPLLLEFLENGNLDLFDNKKSLDYEVDEEHYDIIVEMMVKKLDGITALCVANPGYSNNNKLKMIYEYTETLSPVLQAQAYQRSYEIVSQKVRKLKSNYHSPYKANSTRYFLPEIHKQVNPAFYAQFLYLPEHFEYSKRSYGIWCNNVVVAEAFVEGRRLREFDRETLNTIAKAAKIASDHYNTNGNLNVVKQINEYLYSEEDSGYRVFFYAILFIIKLAVILSSF